MLGPHTVKTKLSDIDGQTVKGSFNKKKRKERKLTLKTSEKKPEPTFSQKKSSIRARLDTALRRARYDEGRMRFGPWSPCSGGSQISALVSSWSILMDTNAGYDEVLFTLPMVHWIWITLLLNQRLGPSGDAHTSPYSKRGKKLMSTLLLSTHQRTVAKIFKSQLNFQNCVSFAGYIRFQLISSLWSWIL